MMRWILLASCLILGGCATEKPPVSAGVATPESENVRSVVMDPSLPMGTGSAPKADNRGVMSAAAVDGGSPASVPVVRGVAEGTVSNTAIARDGGADEISPDPVAAHARTSPLPKKLAQPLTLPELTAGRSATSATSGAPLSLSVPVAAGQRAGANTVAVWPDLPSRTAGHVEPRHAQAYTLSMDGHATAVPAIGRSAPYSLGMGAVTSSVSGRLPSERVALPELPASRPGERMESSVLLLPAAPLTSPVVSNTQAALSIQPWVADVQLDDTRRAAVLDRQARSQQEREEQLRQFRRAFYHFLSVDAGE